MRLCVFLVVSLVVLLQPALAPASTDIQNLLLFQQHLEQQSLSKDQQIIRPTPMEREAISKLLETKPSPKTLNDADIKYLNGLLDKAAWLGVERRIMHEIWKEVTGKEFTDQGSDSSKPGEGAQ